MQVLFILFCSCIFTLSAQQYDLPFMKPVASNHPEDIWYWDVEHLELFRNHSNSTSIYRFKNRKLERIGNMTFPIWRVDQNCWSLLFANPEGNTFCVNNALITPFPIDERKELEWQIQDGRVYNRWNLGTFSDWEFSEDFPTMLIIPIVLGLIE